MLVLKQNMACINILLTYPNTSGFTDVFVWTLKISNSFKKNNCADEIFGYVQKNIKVKICWRAVNLMIVRIWYCWQHTKKENLV